MHDQLILRDETLRVLTCLLPYDKVYGPICEQLALARNKAGGGHIGPGHVRALLRVVTLAETDPGAQIVTRDALKLAAGELRGAVRRLDLDALELDRRRVAVFVLDPDRDTVPAIEDAHAAL